MYTTPDSVREALSAEGREAGNATAAALSDDAISDSIAEIEAEIDGRVSGAPFLDAVPRIIAVITRDGAAYLATLTHRKGNPLPDNHPVVLRYQRTQRLLDQAARGELSLSEDDGGIGEATVVNPYEGDLFGLEDVGLGPQLTREPWVR